MRQLFNSTFNVRELDGSNGFTINGPSAAVNPYLGSSTSAAKDINADGIDDLIIGAPNVDSARGYAYVLFGNRHLPAVIDVSTLKKHQGINIIGEEVLDNTGWLVNWISDLNGDNQNELIVGAPIAMNDARIGRCYVLFGGQHLNSIDSIFLTNLNRTTGFRIIGERPNDLTCAFANAAGDINGDGINDLIIGAPQWWGNTFAAGAGKVYVIFGGETLGVDGDIFLSNLGDKGFTIYGVEPSDATGWPVSNAHDINQDGFDDLLIGAPQLKLNSSCMGKSYIVYGRPDIGLSGSFNLSQITRSNGLIIEGIDVDYRTGYSVNALGDVNYDGVSDIVIGTAIAGSIPGQAYVIFGGAPLTESNTFRLSDLNGVNGFVIESHIFSDEFGFSVSSAGDINHDGLDDILIGAPNPNVGTGQGYVIFGHPKLGSQGVFNISTLDGTNGFQIQGNVPKGQLGVRVNHIDDVNDDGISDIIITAPMINTETGAAYIIYGRAQIPVLLNNQLTVVQDQPLQLTYQNLLATDYSYREGELQFFPTSINNGYFALGSVPVPKFYQQNITDGLMFFVPCGTKPPAFNMTVNNGAYESKTQAAEIYFRPSSFVSRSVSGVSLSTILTWLAVVVGGAAVALVSVRVGMNRLAKKRFKQVFQDYNEDADTLDVVSYRVEVLCPIAEGVLNAVQIANFLGYVNQDTMQHYVDAIVSVLVVVEELDSTFAARFRNASENIKNTMIVDLVDQIKAVLSLSFCHRSQCSFFKPRVTPSMIRDHAQEIAEAITERKPLLEVPEVGGYAIQPGT